MVGSGVDKDPTLIPGSALYSDVFVNVAQALQLTVTDHDGYRSGKKRKNKSTTQATAKYKQVRVHNCADSCHASTISLCCV